MTDQEVRQLALDIVERRVFGTFCMQESEMHLLPQIFKPLLIMDPAEIPEDTVHVYEYMEKAGRRITNNSLTFFSCRFITASLMDRLSPVVLELIGEREHFLHVPQEEGSA